MRGDNGRYRHLVPLCINGAHPGRALHVRDRTQAARRGLPGRGRSIAEAASKLEDAARAKRVQAALAETRAADGAGDGSACQRALAGLPHETGR
jgi:hypothetical protein